MEAEKVWRDEIGKMGERVAKIMKKEKGKSGETHGKKGKRNLQWENVDHEKKKEKKNSISNRDVHFPHKDSPFTHGMRSEEKIS